MTEPLSIKRRKESQCKWHFMSVKFGTNASGTARRGEQMPSAARWVKCCWGGVISRSIKKSNPHKSEPNWTNLSDIESKPLIQINWSLESPQDGRVFVYLYVWLCNDTSVVIIQNSSSIVFVRARYFPYGWTLNRQHLCVHRIAEQASGKWVMVIRPPNDHFWSNKMVPNHVTGCATLWSISLTDGSECDMQPPGDW